MHVRLKDLQNLVSKVLNEEIVLKELREEVASKLGPSVNTAGSLQQVAEEAIYRLDVLARTGRKHEIFDERLSTKLSTMKSSAARDLAARMLPERKLLKLATDPSPVVRHSVARRVSFKVLVEMKKKYRIDDELNVIFESRKLNEAGLPKPKVDDEQFDMYGEEALGDAVKQRDDIELSDQWYESLARKFIQDYGTNLEGQWEELLVKRYCSSVKATSGVEVDTEKLLKCVKDLLEEREELHLKRNELKESVSRRVSHMLPEYVESKDPVKELLHTNCSASQYVALAKSVFKISETIASHSVRNSRLNEGLDISNTVPFSGRLPSRGEFRNVDERAVQRYVDSWNMIQESKGDIVKLTWSPSAAQRGRFTLKIVEKL